MREWQRWATTCAAAGGLPAAVWAQAAVTISGRVTAEGGQPLPGASVYVTALSVGATTRDDGTYALAVPAERAGAGQAVVLAVRRVGYRSASAQVVLQGRVVRQDFALAANALQLGEVVVTGAGLATTAERLGAVRTAVDTAAIARANEPNVAQALAAKAPGVVVTQQAGDPGAGSKVVIRGMNTIQGTGQPLFVVDGTPINNETLMTMASTGGTVGTNRAFDLNPDDVASVEVLKSGAAAAIYGARASQGVILITTKKGRAGETRYALRATGTVDHVNRTVPLQRRYAQGAFSTTAACAGAGCRPSASSFGDVVPAGTPTYDHADDLFEDGRLLDAQLQASGGTDRTTFFLSGGDSDNDGVITGDHDTFRRRTVRLNASQRVSRALQATANVSFANARGSFTQRGSNTSGITLGGWRTPPTFDNRAYLDSATGLQRSYRYPQPDPGSAVATRGYDNPFFVIERQQNTSRVGRSFGNVGLTYAPADWLSVAYTLGADYTSDERLSALPKSSSSFPTGQILRANYVTYIVDHLLNAQASRAWRAGWETRLALGGEFNGQTFQQSQLRGNDLIADAPLTINNTVTQAPDNGGDFRSLVRRESYFAQAQQTVSGDLFLTATLRNDGFSSFGLSNRRNWFGSGQASYVFTNRFTAGGFLSDGKLRVAYGQTGAEPGVYLTNGFFGGGFFSVNGFGDQLLAVQNGQGGLVTAGRLAQPDLRPERQNELEGGFDVAFLRNRADLSVTLYDRVARDVIFDLPLPPTSGYAVQARNAARIRNHGLEAALNVRPVRLPGGELTLGFQFARNRNKVLGLVGADAVDLPTGGFFAGTLVSAVPGYALGSFRTYDFARCGVSTGVIEGEDVGAACQGKAKGTMYIATDGYPVVDPTLRVQGDPTPRWTGAFRPALRLGAWSVSGLLDVRRGGVVWNGTKGALYNFGTHKDTEVRATCGLNDAGDDYACAGNARVFGSTYTPGRSQSDPGTFAVTGPGAGKAVPIGENWFTGKGSGFSLPSAQFFEGGSFAKLREVSVGYTVTSAAFRRLTGFGAMDVRVAGRNLALWTRYTGVDPETNLGGPAVGATGIDYFNTPLTRSVVVTIGLTR